MVILERRQGEDLLTGGMLTSSAPACLLHLLYFYSQEYSQEFQQPGAHQVFAEMSL